MRNFRFKTIGEQKALKHISRRTAEIADTLENMVMLINKK